MHKTIVEQRKGSSETIKTTVSNVTNRPPCELRSSSLESTFAFSDDKSPKTLIQGLQNLGKSLEIIEIKTTPQNSDIIASPEGRISKRCSFTSKFLAAQYIIYGTMTHNDVNLRHTVPYDTISATGQQITNSNANIPHLRRRHRRT